MNTGTTSTAITSQPRQSTTPIPHGRADLFRAFARACRPLKRQSLSEWADKHRILSGKSSSERGKWRTSRTPYLKEIMDHLSSSAKTNRLVLMFAAQLGKTEVAMNWLGYIIDHAPAPTLVVVPTLEARKRWVKQRLNPMIAETPVLRAAIGSRSRDDSNTEEIKDFAGGFLVLSGANSAASLASMPIQNAICDEVDRFPWEVGQEGDPLGLIDERTKTFPHRKILLVSTPTTHGASRIEAEYEQSDMREYHLPCPHCDEYQVLRWRHQDGSFGLVHSKATGDVRYACIHCGTLIDEHHKTSMLANGRWIARHPERKTPGYHLNGLYSPIGLGFSWPELWQKWQHSHGDTANLKRFVNTTLGESWEERGEGADAVSLIARLESYPAMLPIVAKTVGVDVQKDRLELSIVGWGIGEEAWLLDHLIIVGDTATDSPWDELAFTLDPIAPDCCAIDSGYNTTLVESFVQPRKWCHAIKGVAGNDRPIIEDERKRKQRLRYRHKKGMPKEPVGVDQAKAMIYARLRNLEAGPGYIHFPNTSSFDDEYFAQLTAEELVTKVRGNRPKQEWVKRRARNEALDCLVYALAALRLTRIDLDKRSIELSQAGKRKAAAPATKTKFASEVSLL